MLCDMADIAPGNQSIERATLYPLTIIYTILAITGLSGNLATVTVILSNMYMRYKILFYVFIVVLPDALKGLQQTCIF